MFFSRAKKSIKKKTETRLSISVKICSYQLLFLKYRINIQISHSPPVHNVKMTSRIKPAVLRFFFPPLLICFFSFLNFCIFSFFLKYLSNFTLSRIYGFWNALFQAFLLFLFFYGFLFLSFLLNTNIVIKYLLTFFNNFRSYLSQTNSCSNFYPNTLLWIRIYNLGIFTMAVFRISLAHPNLAFRNF